MGTHSRTSLHIKSRLLSDSNSFGTKDIKTKMKVWILLFLTMVSMTRAFVLIDPSTGRSIRGRSPTIQENRSQLNWFNQAYQSIDQGLDVAEDLPVYKPQQRRIPAPEYYAQDGKTPIYKILKKNP